MPRLLRARRHSSGQTLVEFALIIPVFILMMVGVFDVGRAVYASSTINNAAHEAVRLAIVDQDVADVRGKAVSHAVGVGLAPTAVTIRWLNADYADLAPCNATPVDGCTVEVVIDYQFTAATPIIGNLIGTINLQGVARQPIERGYTSP